MQCLCPDHSRGRQLLNFPIVIVCKKYTFCLFKIVRIENVIKIIVKLSGFEQKKKSMMVGNRHNINGSYIILLLYNVNS